MVERSEVIKGYEYEKDQYLLFSEEELSKVAPASARAMEILQFVKKEEVDPLYFDTSYYAVPEDAGRKAYQLLVGAMEESGCAAVAKLTMHQREYTVIIRPRSNGLTLHTMFYTNEVRQVAEYGQPADAGIKEGEKKLALQLIENLVAPFEPQNFSDEYQQRLKALVEAKLAGREMVAATQPQLTPVIDLMEALKKSLAQREQTMKKPPATVIPVTTRRKAGKKAVGG
jgi:DNA end-binding protein Ku